MRRGFKAHHYLEGDCANGSELEGCRDVKSSKVKTSFIQSETLAATIRIGNKYSQGAVRGTRRFPTPVSPLINRPNSWNAMQNLDTMDDNDHSKTAPNEVLHIGNMWRHPLIA